jgi:DNA-binding Lrp family transcriptional regulator
LLSGPKSFTDLFEAIGGSRTTLSNCMKALCEDEIVKHNHLTRNYELRTFGWVNLAQLRTPSSAYSKRRIENDRTIVTENCTANFYPRSGLVRIDESKPNLEAAMAALLDPLYFSLRKPGMITFEIEINLKVQGTVEIVPTQRERLITEWRRKDASLRAEEEYWRKMSWINRERRAYDDGRD